MSLQWHNAVVSNVNAYNSDVNDGAACMSPYEPEHNTDMLIYAANMAGEASHCHHHYLSCSCRWTMMAHHVRVCL